MQQKTDLQLFWNSVEQKPLIQVKKLKFLQNSEPFEYKSWIKISVYITIIDNFRNYENSLNP